MPRRRACVLAALLIAASCGRDQPTPPVPPERSSILLVTLDTTRADAIGPGAKGVQTPAFDALAARGRLFRQAYATAPETLPSHSSMMTGLYPAGHGVHENARFLAASHPVAAERLRQAGYRTAAFVSSFVLSRRFGIARGFDVYDDELPAGAVERTARETTDRAIAYLAQAQPQPTLLWVHYFDPHAPYAPPEPFRRQHQESPYLGEVAAMDEQLGRLVQAFEQRVPEPRAIAVVSDHGEGLGDHGESQHGNLVYQSTMHVPLVLAGTGIRPGAVDAPVSTRRIFHTLMDWAGIDAAQSLRGAHPEVVLGEAMKPFLAYGWQPQIMAVDGRLKAILAGKLEAYDVIADAAEARNLGAGANLPAAMRQALDDYPVPSPEAAKAPDALSAEARRNLASLGYVSASATPVVRKDAPRPADMVHLLDVIERASALFVQERYAQVIPLLEKILSADPHNLDAALRLATAHSSLGQSERALEAFRRAAQIAPRSPDVRLYLALHYARGREWERAVPMLEAVGLWQRVYALRAPTAVESARLGVLAMQIGRTETAIESLEAARRATSGGFAHDLELGVLYLDARRLTDAREALDRIPPSHPDYSMALFKRAQVSVLLNEPDRAVRVARARRHADATTRDLIARERLFDNVR